MVLVWTHSASNLRRMAGFEHTTSRDFFCSDDLLAFFNANELSIERVPEVRSRRWPVFRRLISDDYTCG
jgi:hypothetical protein